MSSDHRWEMESGTLGLRTPDGVFVEVTAAEVVGVEFKGRGSAQGRTVLNKPSDCLPTIEFSRFPLEPWIVLRSPSASRGAECRIVLKTPDGSMSVDSLSEERDHLTVNNAWYPVATSLFGEIQNQLVAVGITPGPISLRQFLALARLGSPRIIVEPAAEAEEIESTQTPRIETGSFRGQLYPYQETGVRWIQRLATEELGGVLGDEMGLGKTIQVIAAFNGSAAAGPSLVVAPATLLENWRREFEKFSPDTRVTVHRGSGRTGFPSVLRKNEVVVTSYETVVRDLSLFRMVQWNFIALDEAQAIKNPVTLRARSVCAIPKRTGLAITGTPIENSLEDVWSILEFSCPGVMGPIDAFRRRFEDTIDGALALEPAVSPLILRRRVADVAGDLPARIDIPVAIEMPGVEAVQYEQLRRKILQQYGASATLVSLTKLRQFCAHPFVPTPLGGDPADYSAKYVRLVEILDEILGLREKAIIFTSFQTMIDLLVSDLKHRFDVPAFSIDGRTPVSDRLNTVDRFSSVPGAAVLVLNPRAAGTGLNIVAANHVIHYNLEWNPAVEDQASARAHRRGQQRPVTVHRLFYASTVEEIVDRRVAMKRELAAAAVVGSLSDEGLVSVAEALRVSPVGDDYR